MNDDTREQLAAYAHEAWSGWMRWMFENGGEIEEDGVWVMYRAKFDRWQRRMNTPYADLPESEKTSDRAEADRMLTIINPEAPQPTET